MSVLKKNSLWGDAVAASQCEGAWNVDGKGASCADSCTGGSRTASKRITRTAEKGTLHPSHEAIDLHRHYKRDTTLLVEMGFKCFRSSVAWTRIFPAGMKEEPNEAGLRFYDDIIEECLKYTVEPLVTISHCEMPFATTGKYNGWASRECVELFVEYAKVPFKRYKEKVKYWLTFNEISAGTVPVEGYLSLGISNEGTTGFMNQKDIPALCFQGIHHRLVTDALAVMAGHETDPDCQAGCMIRHITTYPPICNPNDILRAQQKDQIMNQSCGDAQVRGEYPHFMKRYSEESQITTNMRPGNTGILKQGCVDSYTFSYYISNYEGADKDKIRTGDNLTGGAQDPYLESSDWSWQINPKGSWYTLNELYDHYRTPLTVMENGLGACGRIEEDGKIHNEYHADYLKKHTEQTKEAVRDDVDLTGYTPWGCIDLVSASTGEMVKRYGFIYVEKYDNGAGDLSRREKNSLDWYKKVTESNGGEL